MFSINIGRFILVLVILASFSLGNLDRAFACSCVAPWPPTEALAGATAVFVGKVSNLDVSTGLLTSTADPVEVTFQVSKVWKGPVHSTLLATTARSGASCGYGFERGQEYLVYARGTETELEVSLCSRTQPLSAADEDLAVLGQGNIPTAVDEDLAVLGQGNIPTAEAPDLSTQTLSYPPWVIAFGVIGVGLVMAAFVLIRKRFSQPTPMDDRDA